MSYTDDFDYTGEGDNTPSDVMTRLRAEIDNLVDMEKMVNQMEADLKQAKEMLQNQRTRVVPDLMAEIQCDEMTITHGNQKWKIVLENFISGSLPKEPGARHRAIEWLEQHDGGSLIKTDVNLEFGKSEHDAAITLARQLEADGYPVNVESGVHPQTLLAYARRRMKDGDELDVQALGLYVGKLAKAKSQ